MNFENWDLGVVSTIFVCVLFPINLYFTYWLFITGIIGLHRMEQSTRWKWCIGEVIDAEIKWVKYSKEGQERFPDYWFILVKTYKYIVNEIEYESNQTYACDSIYEKEYNTMDKFPKDNDVFFQSNKFIEVQNEKTHQIGRKITVYYDKKNPKRACLINKINNQIYLPILMGLLFGIGMTILTFKIFSPLFE